MRREVRSFVMPVLSALCVSATPLWAQSSTPAAVQAPLADIVFATDAEARALVAKAKASIKTGEAMAPALPLVRVPGYRALVEYRAAPTPASSHDNDAEIMTVLDGSGTLIIGGTLSDPRRPNAANWNGTGIVGGTPHVLEPGSFIFVPKGVPHYFAKIGPQGLSIVTMHIPIAP
jgi:mannose-6-phosphate isomerase-like protein (cupin superfamily)